MGNIARSPATSAYGTAALAAGRPTQKPSRVRPCGDYASPPMAASPSPIASIRNHHMLCVQRAARAQDAVASDSCPGFRRRFSQDGPAAGGPGPRGCRRRVWCVPWQAGQGEARLAAPPMFLILIRAG